MTVYIFGVNYSFNGKSNPVIVCESTLAWKENVYFKSTVFVLWLPGLTWMVISLKWACVEISPVFSSTMLYCGPFALCLAGRWNHATLHLSCPDGSGILSQRITS